MNWTDTEKIRGFLYLISGSFLISAIVALIKGQYEICKCCGIISYLFLKWGEN